MVWRAALLVLLRAGSAAAAVSAALSRPHTPTFVYVRTGGVRDLVDEFLATREVPAACRLDADAEWFADPCFVALLYRGGYTHVGGFIAALSDAQVQQAVAGMLLQPMVATDIGTVVAGGSLAGVPHLQNTRQSATPLFTGDQWAFGARGSLDEIPVWALLHVRVAAAYFHRHPGQGSREALRGVPRAVLDPLLMGLLVVPTVVLGPAGRVTGVVQVSSVRSILLQAKEVYGLEWNRSRATTLPADCASELQRRLAGECLGTCSQPVDGSGARGSRQGGALPMGPVPAQRQPGGKGAFPPVDASLPAAVPWDCEEVPLSSEVPLPSEVSLSSEASLLSEALLLSETPKWSLMVAGRHLVLLLMLLMGAAVLCGLFSPAITYD